MCVCDVCVFQKLSSWMEKSIRIIDKLDQLEINIWLFHFKIFIFILSRKTRWKEAKCILK